MLRYVGDGAYLLGVPARDLSEEEALALDRQTLTASGLYVDVPEIAEAPAVLDAPDDANLRPRKRHE